MYNHYLHKVLLISLSASYEGSSDCSYVSKWAAAAAAAAVKGSIAIHRHVVDTTTILTPSSTKRSIYVTFS
jgi:hypothetical protein